MPSPLRYDERVCNVIGKRRLDSYARNEGLISALWQLWSYFSRSVVISSALGTTTASGATATSSWCHLSEYQLLAVCQRVARGNKLPSNLQNIPPLRGNYLEPTWGDSAKVIRIVNHIGPTTSNNILFGFGLRNISLDLQIVRNACAHISPDSASDINQLKLKYSNTRYSHPSEVLFWIDPSTGNEAWQVWIHELRLSSDYVVQ